MSDLFGNHIVDFPTRRLNLYPHEVFGESADVPDHYINKHSDTPL